MIQILETKCGNHYFEPVHLYHGRKKIDKNIARENLIDVRCLLYKNNIRWGLIFGTLLGAIRESDFIAHDEDTDIFVFDEDKDELLNQINNLKVLGFEIARYEKTLLSIIKNEEYIDIYFFKKSFRGRWSGSYFVPKKHFEKLDTIKFFGLLFPTLNQPVDYLSYTYGTDWRTPKINSNASEKKLILRNIFLKLSRIIVKLYKMRKINA